MPVEVRCQCGQRVLVEGRTGKRYLCPKCRRLLSLPAVRREQNAALSQPILTPPAVRKEPAAALSQAERGYPATSGIGQLLIVYLVAWAFLFLLSFSLIVWLDTFWIGGALLVAGSLAIASHAVRVLLARAGVLKKGEQPLLFGLLNLIAWNPTEGVLILKNKTVQYVDDNLHDGGGIKLIYPMFGEEVALRVPLEPQSLVFEDADVLTREYLPLNVRGTIKWRIISLEHFYLLVSTELHHASNKGGATPPKAPAYETQGQRKLSLAREWLRWTAEEQTRAVVSKLNTGLLVADQIAADLPPELQEKLGPRALNPTAPVSDGKYGAGTDSLASRIYQDLAEKVRQYGMEIHEVTLQQVRLPAEIHAQCVEACKAAYVPLIAKAEATAQEMRLRAQADVIGAENLAAREIAAAAPAYAVADVLTTLLAKNPALGRRLPEPRDPLLP